MPTPGDDLTPAGQYRLGRAMEVAEELHATTARMVEVTVAQDQVRAHVPTPADRWALALQCMTGPYLREVYETPDGRIEHLTASARTNAHVHVVLHGAVT